MRKVIKFKNQFERGKLPSMILNWNLDKKLTLAPYIGADVFQVFDKIIIHEARAHS